MSDMKGTAVSVGQVAVDSEKVWVTLSVRSSYLLDGAPYTRSVSDDSETKSGSSMRK
jgi:hypothetical protein